MIVVLEWPVSYEFVAVGFPNLGLPSITLKDTGLTTFCHPMNEPSRVSARS